MTPALHGWHLVLLKCRSVPIILMRPGGLGQQGPYRRPEVQTL